MKFDIIRREVYKLKNNKDNTINEDLYYVGYVYYKNEKIKFLIERIEKLIDEKINISYIILDVFNNKYLLKDIIQNYDKNKINNDIVKKVSEYHSTRRGTDYYGLNTLKYPSILKCTEIIETIKKELDNMTEENKFYIQAHIGVYITIYISLEKDNQYINIVDINRFTKSIIRINDIQLKDKYNIFYKVGEALDKYISLYNNNIHDIYYKKKYNTQESDIVCLRKPNTFAIKNNKRIVYYNNIEDELFSTLSVQFKKSKCIYSSTDMFCKSLN